MAAEDCKSLQGQDVEDYKGALRDLVRVVSVAHNVGWGPEDF